MNNINNTNGITEYFEEVETTKEYNGYIFSVANMVTIVILGCICGLKNVKQIHQWAATDKVSKFLKEEFAIKSVPSYYWMMCLLKIIKTGSLNRCFVNWVNSFIPEKSEQLTISLDGKTIRSTNKISNIENPLHIISAQLCELGLTLAQRGTDNKNNEIEAVRELLKELNIKGSIVVADALNCQKETAEIIVDGGADYLLCVKNNHPRLKCDIESHIQDEELQKSMQTAIKEEKNHGRITKRKAFITQDIEWLNQKSEWKNLVSVGAIYTEVKEKNRTSEEWHYYISSAKLTAEELLHHARMEWSVESMHWLLDVHFDEDWCRVENKNVQENLNIFRKAAINIIKKYKSETGSKKPISNIMLSCLIDSDCILDILY